MIKNPAWYTRDYGAAWEQFVSGDEAYRVQFFESGLYHNIQSSGQEGTKYLPAWWKPIWVYSPTPNERQRSEDGC